MFRDSQADVSAICARGGGCVPLNCTAKCEALNGLQSFLVAPRPSRRVCWQGNRIAALLTTDPCHSPGGGCVCLKFVLNSVHSFSHMERKNRPAVRPAKTMHRCPLRRSRETEHLAKINMHMRMVCAESGIRTTGIHQRKMLLPRERFASDAPVQNRKDRRIRRKY